MIGDRLSNRYRLESKLGSGGMSTVYLAHDETLDRQVAVKVLHREISDEADQIERFRREARAVARLSHPNVVAVIDAGEDGGHPYIVFEHVEGETLKKRIQRLGPLPLDEAAAYAIEIGRGLAAAHEARMVHRDVKPQNVLVDSEGRAKVTDFGIARSLEADGLTATGRVLGTTDYVSPEQAMGHDVDPRSDIYSLGVVLYEMLVGDVPFHAENQVGVAMKHVNDSLPDVQRRRPETSSALIAVLERATSKEPGDRHHSMDEMLAELEGALEVEISRAGHATGEATAVIASVPRQRRRILTPRRVSWAGVMLLAGAGAAALALAVLTGEEGPSRAVGTTGRAPIEIVGTGDFDPAAGGGDESEHPELAELAVDGDPSATAWTTETYSDAELGGKEGVGLVLDAGEEVRASGIEIRTAEGGWSGEVYGSAESSTPETLEDWDGPLGAVKAAKTQQTIELDATSEHRLFLVWFTSLAEGTEGFRVEVLDVRLLGE